MRRGSLPGSNKNSWIVAEDSKVGSRMDYVCEMSRHHLTPASAPAKQGLEEESGINAFGGCQRITPFTQHHSLSNPNA